MPTPTLEPTLTPTPMPAPTPEPTPTPMPIPAEQPTTPAGDQSLPPDSTVPTGPLESFEDVP
jgi:hypothetical protein